MPQVTFLGVKLVDGLKRRNWLAYLFAVFISSGYAGALSILQPGLLQVIGIPYAEQATLTGMLGGLQEAIFIVMMGLYGVLADLFGRRVVYVFGLALTAIGFTLYGSATSVEELILYRVIVAFGSAAIVGMMVTVVADYSHNTTRGKANGMQGAVATFGAFIPPILAALPKGFVTSGYSEATAQQATFAIAGALGAVAAVVAFIGLSKMIGTVVQSTKEPLLVMLSKGAKAAKNPAIALSYGAAFISRGDLAVTGAFMGLWLVQFGTGTLQLSTSDAMAQLAVPAILMVVGGALVGSILTGYISDKVTRISAVSIASGLAGCVYSAMYFVSDPTASWVFPLLFVMGIAEISAFVASQALVGEQAPKDRKGAVIGLFGVAGAVGILLATTGGGYLFGHVSPSSPFVLFGVLNLVVFVWSLILSRRLSNLKSTEQ
ncbi:MFS transporter [Paraglaciecola hydrolytica]|uniref:MFS transporter n=1 Tax=Paraglaciecola hydrolytica TaxID=1799789 RepID=A0A136A5M6_9ALTE|nr:MFS transporter [Paraglaciecola hydrolytica]KXI30430.1 MFS transporter [Paraglaciecola hydrolytica]